MYKIFYIKIYNVIKKEGIKPSFYSLLLILSTNIAATTELITPVIVIFERFNNSLTIGFI